MTERIKNRAFVWRTNSIRKHLMEALIASSGQPSVLFDELMLMFQDLKKKMPPGSFAEDEASHAAISAQVASESGQKRWYARLRKLRSAPDSVVHDEYRARSLTRK